MNIVTPIPSTMAFPTANINTEAVRRDNLLRETIPQTSDADKGAAESGLGSESDKTKNPGQRNNPVTYERPQSNTLGSNAGELPDNAQDESAGREDAEQRQRDQAQGQQTQQADQTQQQAQQQEVEQLKSRDQEVRTHEQAHAAIGGQYAGAPQYEFTTGPDNKRYATEGMVSIDISEASSPEQTVRKMQQVRAAALAPAQPSAQDLRVANEATQKAFEARSELAEQTRNEQQAQTDSVSSNDSATDSSASSTNNIQPQVPSLDDIVDGNDISPPSRKLDEQLSQLAQASGQPSIGAGIPPTGNDATGNSYTSGAFEVPEMGTRSLEIDPAMQARINVIQQTYQAVSQPATMRLSLSA